MHYHLSTKITLTALFVFLFFQVSAQVKSLDSLLKKADSEVNKAMKKGNIPGLSLVIIANGQQIIRNYGYADLQNKVPVTSNTLFEIGSCSKAFTALAMARLVDRGQINPDASVSDYLPWFRVTFKGKAVKISIKQLLHHTSGIPWKTISNISPIDNPDALEQTVRTLQNQKLAHLPGKKFEYATINYDICALIIQSVTQQPFENYVQEQVINPLKLSHTQVGYPVNSSLMAKGYKSAFYHPEPFTPPVFKGNNAAGYVISNATDMSEWLKFQMGLKPSVLFKSALWTQQRDESVELHQMSSYAMGWEVALNGSGEIYHDGFNPSFTAYTAFRPRTKTGVVIMANASSNYTAYLGALIIKIISGDEPGKGYEVKDGGDSAYSIVSVILVLYILVIIGYSIFMFIEIGQKKRAYSNLNFSKVSAMLKCLFILLPFVYAVYLLPKATVGFNWSAIFVWSPFSLQVCLVLLTAAVSLSYLTYVFSIVYPAKNTFRGKMPLLVLLGILAGFANMIIIILITSSLNTDADLKYFYFYYLLMALLYLMGRRYVQIQLIRFSRGLTYNLRIELVGKILGTSHQKFEKIPRGNIYTSLNDDVGVIGESTNVFIILITNFITAIGAFIYLASIAFWATLITVCLVVIILIVYYFAGNSTNVYFEQARNSQNIFMNLTSDMIEGFKEISLQKGKKQEYQGRVSDAAQYYKEKIVTASIRFVNVSLIGETLLIIVLGVVAFGFPKMFPSIQVYTISSFVVILLYLIGPINSILSSIPALLQVRIAWNRIQEFIKTIPVNNKEVQEMLPVDKNIQHIAAHQLTFAYQSDNGEFSVGPINLEINKGEIIFIIGGNGSGKTTLAKLLTGLYTPTSGEVRINGKAINPALLGEYYSAIFSPAYLFDTLYNVDLDHKREKIDSYLKTLGLEGKVSIIENRFSTLELSGGQKKRLALLQCYLEDSPIYLFDEWAADQDPDYRKFFYRNLLPEMRAQGKIVIAITHDDHYFDVADKVLKMDMGQLEYYRKLIIQ
ncbi:cyclic peptide export ABC transporter [Pedobacter steynii]|uniref:Cyclic peptide transporter n=1 Tax=Pedobacter steynii TaxID=430522 RepID=A0A1D7QNA9_9SPHI|nr:cyclic peptide export ABC transporter [Pedobacter steynii]AOM80156.1 hypothetical protein BFS30_25145 [Pedobacter steynii]